MKLIKNMGLSLIYLVVVLVMFNGCTKSEPVSMTAAGATFPQLLYTKMFEEYAKDKKDVSITYHGIGSGKGIEQLLQKTVDFGGTDAYMSDEKMQKADSAILHFPTCLGAVSLTYNLPVKSQLKLSPDLIADMFLGKITRWSDPKIAAENPEMTLPDMDITIVHRTDSSGTTFIFSDYLCKVNKEWEERVGRGKVLAWPVGVKGKGNPGMANVLKQLQGAIGYIEVSYAKQENLSFAMIKNRSGNYITPELESISQAAAGSVPDDTRVTITDTDAPDGYPISSFTWVILYKEQDYLGRTKYHTEMVLDLLWWMVHEGQEYNNSLYYGRLPENVIKKAEVILRSVTYKGNAIIE
jgi:phosphate transport system substrate-binding protein